MPGLIEAAVFPKRIASSLVLKLLVLISLVTVPLSTLVGITPFTASTSVVESSANTEPCKSPTTKSLAEAYVTSPLVSSYFK